MDFQNLTWFPALAFQGVTQAGRPFHVVALRQTLVYQKGSLVFAEDQSPFCEEDGHFGEPLWSSVRAESDYCPWKPRCDLVVNAIAHAPGGMPAEVFWVRLRVWRPGTHARLVDKTLQVSGPSEMRQRNALGRILATAVRWGSLGLVAPSAWWRTDPEPVLTVPVRYEYAYGGQAKVMVSEPASTRVWPKDCLPGTDPRQIQEGFEATGVDAPLAWELCGANPLGNGWARAWHLKATRCRRLRAPQVEAYGAALTGPLFHQMLLGKEDFRAHPAFRPQGLGLLGKAWIPRRHLVGTVDPTWIQSGTGLPKDFDFGIWNGAPPDQQPPFLAGDEVLELTNHCAPGIPAAKTDECGNTLLRLELPGNLPLLLVRQDQGPPLPLPMDLDTVLVDPEAASLVLVWRAVLPLDDDPAKVVETRMLTRDERDTWVRSGVLKGLWPPQDGPRPAKEPASGRDGTYG